MDSYFVYSTKYYTSRYIKNTFQINHYSQSLVVYRPSLNRFLTLWIPEQYLLFSVFIGTILNRNAIQILHPRNHAPALQRAVYPY